MKDVKGYFEDHAQKWVENAYDHSTGTLPIGIQRINLVLSILKQHYSDKILKVCDVGCGDGTLCRTLAKLGHDVTGIDQSENMITLAKDKTQAENLNVKYVVSSIEDIEKNINGEKFDVVTSMGVMYYVEDENQYFCAVKSLLSIDGLILITCRNRLFNLFSGSKKRKSELAHEDLLSLLEELAELSTDLSVDDTMTLTQALHEVTSPKTTSTLKLPPEKQQEKTKKLEKAIVEGRQHTPKQLEHSVNKNGLKVKQFYGVQPHFLAASSTDAKANQQLKKISEALLPLAKLPISLTWSSHFLVEITQE